MRIIRFTTSTCGPCKMSRGIWLKVANNPDYSDFEFVEAIMDQSEEFEELRKKYNVNRTPTQLFVDADGNEVDRYEGYLPEHVFKKLIEEVRAKVK